MMSHHHRHHGHHRGCSPLCTNVRHELLDLSNRLRQERLYVQHEKLQLQELNTKVRLTSEKLSHVAWIAHQQRENLDGLIFSTRGHETSPAHCCIRANLLEQTVFLDAYKQLGHHEIVYSDFLRILRRKSRLLANCLNVGDKLNLNCMPNIISTVFSGLYGSCLVHNDEMLVLKLLRHLMKIQLTSAPNPRKLLRQGNCAFSRLYKCLSEELFSAKLFLTSALYEPILSLLSDDEIFLDIDPAKTAIRFPPSDRLKKFGQEGSSEYDKNVKRHRDFVIGKLESLTNSFIQGIRDNLHCFPPTLGRLLRSMYRLLMSSGRAEPREVNAVCVDVIFYLFICPAMVDPNPVGIIDTPISYIARSNLMQVAQILQVLAMWKWEEVDPRLMDLYSRFDKEAMPSVLEVMLETANDLGTSDDDDEDYQHADEVDGVSGGSMVDNVSGHGVEADALFMASPRLSRLAVLLTRNQLDELVTFLRTIREASTSNVTITADDVNISDLNELIAQLPETVPGSTKKPSTSTPVLTPTKSMFKSDVTSSSAGKSPVASKSEDSLVALASAKKQLLTHKLSNVATTVSSRASALSSNMRSSSGLFSQQSDEGSSHDSTVSDNLLPTAAASGLASSSTNSLPNVQPRNEPQGGSTAASVDQEPDTVLIIPIGEGRSDEPPGFLSEELVISQSRQLSSSRVVRMNLANLPGEDDENGHHGRHVGSSAGGGGGGNSEENSSLVSGAGEKRTRFSLSHDDGSIGNTSDNLEAISEAASNHSVDSSLEDEDDPVEDPIIDNLSDMVSANVSGRGTPNVSGRDTPSSQVTEGDELGGGGDSGPNDGGPKGPAEAQHRVGGAEVGVGGGAHADDRGHPRDDEVDANVHPPVAAQPGDEGRAIGGGRGHAGGVGGGGGGRRKTGEPDLDEKFGRFEIKPQARSSGSQNLSMTGAAGSEQGDETISMVSDTWSTDVLASDTETLGDGDGLMHHHVLLLHQRRQARGGLAAGSSARPGVQIDLATGGSRGGGGLLDDLIESPTHGSRQRASLPGSSDHGSLGGPTSGPGHPLRPGIEGSGGSQGSASAANLFDISETCSDAWSMDVLASDTESLRLAELDNEDSASVARSDDTRFTDETARSDPEPLLDFSGGSSSASTGQNLYLGSRGGGSSRHRRDDVTIVRRGLSSESNSSGGGLNLLRPTTSRVEQWAQQSGGSRTNLIPRRGSESSGHLVGTGDSNVLKSKASDPMSVHEESLLSDNEAVASSTGTAATTATVGGASSSTSSRFQMSSHLSATSIASSTESSNGESGAGFSMTPVSALLTTTEATPSLLHSDVGGAMAAASVVAERDQDDHGLRCLIDGEMEVVTSLPQLTKSASEEDTSAKTNQNMKSTGAIPKSISFDKNIRGSSGSSGSNGRFIPGNHPSSPTSLFSDLTDGDQGLSNHLGLKFKKRDNSFFKGLKLPKFGRNRIPQPNSLLQQQQNDLLTQASDLQPMMAATANNNQATSQQFVDLLCDPSEESSDDILAKYRKRPSGGDGNADHVADDLVQLAAARDGQGQDDNDFLNNDEDERLVIDPHNIEASFAFQDAKRKLRMMLSEADVNILSSLPMTSTSSTSSSSGSAKSRSNELVWLLRVQLAEAHNLQDRNLVAQLYETLRCLLLFDNEGCRKLLRSLREDYKRRSPYLSYLVRCRQGLLTTLAHQERILLRMEMDRRVCMNYLISVCVRLFLEQRERELSAFVADFKTANAADEKITLMERFLAELNTQLESDSMTMLWSLMMSEEHQDLCRLTVERSVVSQIYVYAMYPNGEADISRDEVLAQHIRRLSGEITPGHRDLRIPGQYHYEQPWPSAQAEIRRLAAYKTPQDKVACVVRCSQTIMNLLSLASSKSVPAADDFVPVMVFVIIKANPPSLLSTVQYVDSFYGSRLCGEDQYWWMQFASAIEFIKTMDYRQH